MKINKHFSVVLLFILIFSSNIIEVEAEEINKEIAQRNKSEYHILVDITEFKLYLINKQTTKVEKIYPIAGGKPITPSPYGTWRIVYKAENWGAGFGTRWMALNVPWGKYGIHGTNKPLTISNPDSLGCIRMFNKDIEELYKYVNPGTVVVIYGGPYNLSWYKFRDLKPGDRGADVLEVQRTLQERGYYLGKLDGVYGENMKSEVIKFKKDNKLKFTHDIDKEVYDALQMEPFE